jgi:hypothetical protein
MKGNWSLAPSEVARADLNRRSVPFKLTGTAFTRPAHGIHETGAGIHETGAGIHETGAD